MSWFDTNAPQGAAPPTGMSQAQYDYQVQALKEAYWRYLYRVPNQDEIDTYAAKPEAEFNAHLASIPSSWESRRALQVHGGKENDAPYGSGTGGGSGDGGSGEGGAGGAGDTQWILDALKAVNSTDDPNYWIKVIRDHNDLNNASARAYWIDRIRRGDGSELVRNGTLTKFQDGGANGGPGAFGAGVEPYKPFTLGDFMQDPGYQFTLQQGQDAIHKNAAARGTLLTGGTQKALQQYTTGLAQQQYDNWYNRQRTDYTTNRDTFYANQDRPFDKWFKMAGLGANAAAR